jgi:hypothetical protein
MLERGVAMIRKRKGKGYQQVIEVDPHSAYTEAAAAAKREWDKVVDLLVDEMLKEGMGQLAEIFQVVVEGSRKADALWQWAVESGVNYVKVPQDKIRELQDIQLALAAYFIQKRDRT